MEIEFQEVTCPIRVSMYEIYYPGNVNRNFCNIMRDFVSYLIAVRHLKKKNANNLRVCAFLILNFTLV